MLELRLLVSMMDECSRILNTSDFMDYSSDNERRFLDKFRPFWSNETDAGLSSVSGTLSQLFSLSFV